MTERNNKYLKHFEGDRALKRYQNEIQCAQMFPLITPRVISRDDKNLRLEFELLRGDNTAFTKSGLVAIGRTLAQTHKQAGIESGEWVESGLLSRYQATNISSLRERYQSAKGEIEAPRYSLTHGDYRRRNIFLTEGDGVKVIDWEFAGTNLIYWDLAIFLGDMRHQRYHKIHDLDDSHFLEAYTGEIPLTDEEANFCRVLGGVDIVLDHMEPRQGEKPPEPSDLFVNFNEEEMKYLLHSN